jgi:CheY-like chemotaxis protein
MEQYVEHDHDGHSLRDAVSPLVLIVDDDVNSREAVEALLELGGYQVAAAGDGREALDLLDSGLRPALIVLDMNMPRMDGVEFRRAQRHRPAIANIPVIVCSGCMDDGERLAALGSVTFLSKPIAIDRFEDAVHRQCPR